MLRVLQETQLFNPEHCRQYHPVFTPTSLSMAAPEHAAHVRAVLACKPWSACCASSCLPVCCGSSIRPEKQQQAAARFRHRAHHRSPFCQQQFTSSCAHLKRPEYTGTGTTRHQPEWPCCSSCPCSSTKHPRSGRQRTICWPISQRPGARNSNTARETPRSRRSAAAVQRHHARHSCS